MNDLGRAGTGANGWASDTPDDVIPLVEFQSVSPSANLASKSSFRDELHDLVSKPRRFTVTVKSFVRVFIVPRQQSVCP
jgi:hypothetical protein